MVISVQMIGRKAGLANEGQGRHADGIQMGGVSELKAGEGGGG